jgi:hypothetical protein
MTATRLFRTLGVATGLTVASIALAGAASAKPLVHGEFHDETTDIVEDFCDVAGLTVQVDRVFDVRLLANPHGPDGLAYGLEHQTFTEVWTYPANGNAFTVEFGQLSKVLRVTDNGDGTLTIRVLATATASRMARTARSSSGTPASFASRSWSTTLARRPTRSTTSSSSSSASSGNRPDAPTTSARPPSRYSSAEGQANGLRSIA